MQFSKWVTLGFGAICLIAVAGMLNAPHLYYMAAILLTLPAVSYFLGWFTLRGLTFSRETQGASWEGEESEIVYTIHNASALARFFLSIHELLPPWIELADRENSLFNVPARQTVQVSYRVRFLHRGFYQESHFEVIAMDPLGVFAFTRRVSCEIQMVVYPALSSGTALALAGSERYAWQDLAAAARGNSVDPDGVRAYAPGDPLRHIHWRQTARTGRLSVVEFEEAQSINLVIALDLYAGSEVGSGLETTLEYAVRLTASAAHEAIRDGASVRLVPSQASGEDVDARGRENAGRGQEQLFNVLDVLARAEATSSQPINEVVANCLGVLLPGTTLLVVTSQADPALPGAIIRYVATGALVSVAFIDAGSFDPARVGRADTVSFVGELLASGAEVFVVQKKQPGAAQPEKAYYAANAYSS